MILPLSQHLSSTKERTSFVVIEAVVLIPIIGGVLSYVLSSSPLSAWLARALVAVVLIILATPYLRMLRRLHR